MKKAILYKTFVEIGGVAHPCFGARVEEHGKSRSLSKYFNSSYEAIKILKSFGYDVVFS